MDDRMGGRLWLRGALAVILTAGLSVSTMLIRHHENRVYGDASAGLANCPETETVNCDTVNTSAWSEMLGIPIAAFAIPTYLLLMFLILETGSSSRNLPYAFCIGLLTTFYSVFLFYISSTKVGFICLYCVSLYGVNVSIPILTALIARRSPLALIRETLSDLRSWPKALRVASFTFVALLAVTIGVEQAYRLHVKREAALEQQRIEEQGGPLVPAGPETSATVPGRHLPSIDLFASPAEAATDSAHAPAEGEPYKLPGPMRRIERGPKVSPFDLQSRLGHGKPVALIFWAPGNRESERSLVNMTEYLRKQVPAFELYAVAGRSEDSREEEVLETATMLSVPADLPLLLDDKFALSSALATFDVPNVTLFDAKGRLVISKLKARGQQLVLPAGSLTGEEVIQRLASGTEVPEIKQMAQYYPATELYQRCAPEFQAKKFDTDELFDFKGHSDDGRPVLLLYWSSTCKHCQVEVPLMVAWLKKNPGRIDVISVTHLKNDKPGHESHREITKRYIKDKEITWPVLEDPDGAIGDLYRSISTPTSYFITTHGTIVGAWFYPHPLNFDKAMEEALAKVKALDTGACNPGPETPGPRMAFDMLNPDGKKVSLASKLGQPVLVHMWATWCGPCMEEMPSLLRFGEKLEKSGSGHLVLLSVEDAAAGERIAGFGKKLGTTLPSNRAPTGGLADSLDLAYRIPRTYVVAPNGTVVDVQQGNQDWDDPQFDERILSWLRNANELAR